MSTLSAITYTYILFKQIIFKPTVLKTYSVIHVFTRRFIEFYGHSERLPLIYLKHKLESSITPNIQRFALLT